MALAFHSCHFGAFRARSIEKSSGFFIMETETTRDERTERRNPVYEIVVLAREKQEGRRYADMIRKCCTERQLFPLVEVYEEQETFFGKMEKTAPAAVFLTLPGVDGLNAAEHLRSLRPECVLIWCSDLNFSLHAFRLRVEYFFMEPAEEKKIREGLEAWFARIGVRETQDRTK